MIADAGAPERRRSICLRQAFLALVPVTGLLIAAGASAARADTTLFILDVSGSMAQKLGAGSKMDAAKATFSELIDGLPAALNVGLELYGHRGDKDCSVIEVPVPPRPLDAAAIKASVAPLQPRKGATPIAASLERAGQVLAGAQGRKSVVLISDGEETCGGDPVAAAKALRGQDVNFALHVIGFGVNAKQRAQLEAVAASGGGNYYDAQDAAALKASLQEVKKKVASRVLFRDDFDGEMLGDAWEVLNPSEDNMVLDDGKLITISQPGNWEKESIPNLLLYRGADQLPKNWVIVAKMSTEVLDYPGNSNQTAWVGLVLYKDKVNQLELNINGRCCGDRRRANYQKLSGGKWLPGYEHSFGAPATEPRPYYLKIEKKRFEYTAYVSEDGTEWAKVGTHKVLGKKLRPGLFAVRAGGARETTTEWDWVEIRAIE